jgi:nucleotide-binding universal stress UspA family protein
MSPIRVILHPTDFSPHAEYAFQVACWIARDQGARVIVLHVGERPRATFDEAARAANDRQVLEEQLHRIQPPAATTRVEHRLEEGVADTEILRVAQETDCDLIVMGTQGKMGVGKTVLPGRWVGSVAGKVLRGARRPVLTVNTPDAESSTE